MLGRLGVLSNPRQEVCCAKTSSVLCKQVKCAAAMQHVFALANHVTALLNGATDPDPSQHGMTTEEERASSSTPQVSQCSSATCLLCVLFPQVGCDCAIYASTTPC